MRIDLHTAQLVCRLPHFVRLFILNVLYRHGIFVLNFTVVLLFTSIVYSTGDRANVETDLGGGSEKDPDSNKQRRIDVSEVKLCDVELSVMMLVCLML